MKTNVIVHAVLGVHTISTYSFNQMSDVTSKIILLWRRLSGILTTTVL